MQLCSPKIAYLNIDFPYHHGSCPVDYVTADSSEWGTCALAYRCEYIVARWHNLDGQFGQDRWDLRTGEQLVQHNFSSSISTLGFCPTEKWLAVGFKDSQVYVLHETMAFRYQLPFHNSYVTNLKFVNSGQWFVSTGLDRMLNFWKTPNTSMFQIRECSGITSRDISADDTYIATACEYDMVSVYHVMY